MKKSQKTKTTTTKKKEQVKYKNKSNSEKTINDKVSPEYLKIVLSLNPDLYEIGGMSAVYNYAKMLKSQQEIRKTPKSKKLTYAELKRQRETLGYKTTKKDYKEYLNRYKR